MIWQAGSIANLYMGHFFWHSEENWAWSDWLAKGVHNLTLTLVKQTEPFFKAGDKAHIIIKIYKWTSSNMKKSSNDEGH